MFELHIQNTEVQTGTIPVSWCVDKETLDDIREKLAETCASTDSAFVLLVARPCGEPESHEIRQLVALTDLMTYFQFQSAGSHTMLALLLLGEKKRLTDFFLSRSAFSYNATVFKNDLSGVLKEPAWIATYAYAVAEPVDVVVPAECFAEEPWQWEKKWVNAMFSNPPRDQCDYRRRRLFAYTLQPFFFFLLGTIIYAVRVIVTAFCVLCTCRGINFGPLIRPFSYDEIIRDITEDIDGVFIIPKKLDNTDLALCLFPFIPLVMIVVFGVVTLIADLSNLQWTLLRLVAVTIVVCMALSFILGVILLVSALRNMPAQTVSRVTPLSVEDEVYLVCQDGRRVLGIGDLPPKRRTIRLRFMDLKARVCRPFAQ